MTKRRGTKQVEIEKQERLVDWLKERIQDESVRLLDMRRRAAV